MKFTRVEGKRFTKEKISTTLAILGVVSLPLIVIAVILHWQTFITFWWICVIASAIITLTYKIINLFKKKNDDL
jgi:hypothetical protein